MATLAGRWTLRCIGLEAGWAQGVLISGSLQNDGVVAMTVGTEVQHVEGAPEFTITPQAFDPVNNTWITSLEQENYEWDDNVGMKLTISADDTPPTGDLDFNDLVVLCISEDEDLVSPNAGLPRPDYTIPEQMIRFND